MGRGWKSLETHDTLPWTPLLRGDVSRVGGGEPPSVCQPEVCSKHFTVFKESGPSLRTERLAETLGAMGRVDWD